MNKDLFKPYIQETIMGETNHVHEEDLLARNPGKLIEAFLADDDCWQMETRMIGHGFMPVTYRKIPILPMPLFT